MNRRAQLRPRVESLEQDRQAAKEREKQSTAGAKGGSGTVPDPPILTPQDGLAAGLGESAARLLVKVSETYRTGLAFSSSKEVTVAERQAVRTACMDVLSVVGFGSVDTFILNHFIREILRQMLRKRMPLGDNGTNLAVRLMKLMASPSFIGEALDTLDKSVQKPDDHSGTLREKKIQSGVEITRRWIQDGGWRTYWLALSVMRALGVTIPLGSSFTLPLDGALSVALGYHK